MTVTCVRPMLRTDLDAVLAIEAQANPVPWKAGDFETFLRPPFQAGGGFASRGPAPEAFSGTAGTTGTVGPAAGNADAADLGRAAAFGPGGGAIGWVWADPEVQGFACVVGAADEAELQSIAVARDHWGRGVGSALMETLCGWCRAHALRTVHLEVRESNARALEFYARWGFAAAGRRPAYYRDNAEAALLLVKTL